MFKGQGTLCDSLRHIAMTSRLVCTAACTYVVAAICCTYSDQFEFLRQIALTTIFTSHLSRRSVAAICRMVCLGLKTKKKEKHDMVQVAIVVIIVVVPYCCKVHAFFSKLSPFLYNILCNTYLKRVGEAA